LAEETDEPARGSGSLQWLHWFWRIKEYRHHLDRTPSLTYTDVMICAQLYRDRRCHRRSSSQRSPHSSISNVQLFCQDGID
ncbi:hypothetical protein T4D_4059, partial [Trichinella pseudospiralis]